ncbi:MAG: proline hydroxylase [Betaproteobacteria bacterium]|nr:MAG: proline hydroxylase [Betaproteobacteria bacterium]
MMDLVVQQADVREIKVKLLLAGGQSATLVLAPDHPLLARLFAAVAGEAAISNTSVFQIPIEGGRASLTFPAHRLVGVITDPAVVVRGRTDTPLKAGVAIETQATAAMATASTVPDSGTLVRHPIVQIDDFLTDAELARLMEVTLWAEPRFKPSPLSSYRADPDHRQSLMIAAPYKVSELMLGKIRAIMPEVMEQLRIGAFTVGKIDCQITANVDGSYFKAHTDAGHDGPIKRVLTYVYYFNRDPKGFTGGELRIYDDELRNGKFVATESFQIVEPRNNSIVFFNAALMHEIMPVVVPSKQFSDARFTVNGWVERA